MYNLQYLSVAGFVRANLICVFQAAGTVVSSEIVQGPALGSLECSILNSLGDCADPSGSISNPVIFKFDAVRSTTAHHGAAPAKDAVAQLKHLATEMQLEGEVWNTEDLSSRPLAALPLPLKVAVVNHNQSARLLRHTREAVSTGCNSPISLCHLKPPKPT